MKRRSSKGLTLIELLAIIVLIAVAVVTTVPIILTTLNHAKEKSFYNAANSVASWFEKQYQSESIYDDNMVKIDSDYKDVCIKENCKSKDGLIGSVLTDNVIMASGLKITDVVGKIGEGNIIMNEETINDYTTSYVMIDTTTGRSCVKLVSTENGDFPKNSIACGGVCNSNQCVSKIN